MKFFEAHVAWSTGLALSFLLVGALPLVAAGKEPTLLEKENERYDAELEAGTKKLKAIHIERLNLILKSLMAAGDLDGCVAVRDEIKALSGVAVASGSGAGASAPAVPAGDISFLAGSWTLAAGGVDHPVNFDDKGHFHSSYDDAWGDKIIKREGNKVEFSADKIFTIVSRDYLQGVDGNGNKTGEHMARNTSVAAPSDSKVNPFGKSDKK